jgi:hypothetical protein
MTTTQHLLVVDDEDHIPRHSGRATGDPESIDVLLDSRPHGHDRRYCPSVSAHPISVQRYGRLRMTVLKVTL